MKWRKWLEKWDMTSLKIKTPFLNMEWQPQDADKAAAWELYIELLTRITTQPLDAQHGDEKTVLDSIYSLFTITRQVLKNNTRSCAEFAKLAVVILNQVVRPFTSKWHRLSLQGAFDNPEKRAEFRKELGTLQLSLVNYPTASCGALREREPPHTRIRTGPLSSPQQAGGYSAESFIKYARMLADMAGVEDLTALEDNETQ